MPKQKLSSVALSAAVAIALMVAMFGCAGHEVEVQFTYRPQKPQPLDGQDTLKPAQNAGTPETLKSRQSDVGPESQRCVDMTQTVNQLHGEAESHPLLLNEWHKLKEALWRACRDSLWWSDLEGSLKNYYQLRDSLLTERMQR